MKDILKYEIDLQLDVTNFVFRNRVTFQLSNRIYISKGGNPWGP